MNTGAELDEISPGGSFDEVIFLEVLGVGFDEIFSGKVFHGEESLRFLSKHLLVVKYIKINI